jgi:hypothetical protein
MRSVEMKWYERVEDRFIEPVVYWPINCAKGRHWSIKLAAITFGWLWMLPVGLLVLFPWLLMVSGPILVWEMIDD